MRRNLLIISMMLFSCSKEKEPDAIFVDLALISTNTPKTQISGQDIVSTVKCYGPNLCYRFSNFVITESSSKVFDINAKATFPNPKKGDVVCATAIYYADTTVAVHTATKGQYVLRFYNNNVLFKSDTVQVN